MTDLEYHIEYLRILCQLLLSQGNRFAVEHLEITIKYLEELKQLKGE